MRLFNYKIFKHKNINTMSEKIIMTKKQLQDKNNKDMVKKVQKIYEKVFGKSKIVQNPLSIL